MLLPCGPSFHVVLLKVKNKIEHPGTKKSKDKEKMNTFVYYNRNQRAESALSGNLGSPEPMDHLQSLSLSFYRALYSLSFWSFSHFISSFWTENTSNRWHCSSKIVRKPQVIVQRRVLILIDSPGWWMALFAMPIPYVVWESYLLRRWECYSISCQNVSFCLYSVFPA